MELQKYSKAFVPVGVAVVLALLSSLGVTAEMTVEDAVMYLVTAAVVYWVPNKRT